MKKAGHTRNGETIKHAVIAGLIAIVIAYITVHTFVILLRTQNQRNTIDNKIQELAQEIDKSTFFGVRRTLYALSSSDEIIDLLNKKTEPENSNINLTIETSRKIINASIVYVMNTKGNVVASTFYEGSKGEKKSLFGKNYIFRPYFKDAMLGRDVIYPALGITTGKRGIYCSTPVYKPDSVDPIGVVVIKIGLSEIDSLLKTFKNTVMLVTSDGIVFASNNPGWLYHTIMKMPEAKLESIQMTRQFADKVILPLPFYVEDGSFEFDGMRFLSDSKEIQHNLWRVISYERVNPEFKLGSTQKQILAIAILSISMLMIIIVVLILQIQRRRNFEAVLKESERDFRAIFNQTFQFTGLISLEGVLLKANNTALDGIGKKESDEVGKLFWETSWWNHSPKLQEQLKDAFKKASNGSLVRFEAGIQGKEGKEIYIDFSLRPIVDDNEQISSLIAEGRDIGERRAAEQAVQKSEENLRIILNSIGDAVVATDNNGNIIRMNPVAEKLSGMIYRDVRSKKFNKIFHFESIENTRLEDPIQYILNSGHVYHPEEKLILKPDGNRNEINVQVTGAPIFNATGDNVGTVMVIRDVTEQAKIEEQLRQSQKMDSIGKLAGGVAHDFNNMLGGIIGFAELLAKKLKDFPKLQHYPNRIIEAAKRSSDLTSKLLAFSRKGKLVTVDLNINETIDEAIHLMEHSIDKRITIERNFICYNPDMRGDPTQLQNVILNLGVNARDAMENGGTITFTTENVFFDNPRNTSPGVVLSSGDYIKITVSDTGCGIKKSIIEHIFEPFFTTKEVGKGTGLGLSAVYGTIIEHEGGIEVTSTLGKGTSFYVYLPLGDEIKEPQNNINLENFTSKATVLVVDDEEVLREMAKSMLEDVGMKVFVAQNGLEAIEIYKNHQNEIDIVVLDLIMPKLSGKDCYKQIVEINPDVKVLISTGFADQIKPDDIPGFNENILLKKPYTQRQLNLVLKKLLST